MENLTKPQIKKLIKKLKAVGTTCHDCGQKYGVYSVGCSSTWIGICPVCDKEGRLTESRDYAYFITGIRKLTQMLNEKEAN